MKILVLGGTWFLGRAIVEEALRRGDEVTTFNRGISGPDVGGVEAIRGDRNVPTDVGRLVAGGRSWDAVFDTGGFVPRSVQAMAGILAHHVERYVFISTVSVYEGWPIQPLTDESPVLACPADADADFGSDDPRGYPTQYGIQKAGCERAVFERFGANALILRPGVILGPYEYVGRLPWWLRRMLRGGQVLAPGKPEKMIQPIDVRDVAAFGFLGVENGLGGSYNVASPRGHTTYGAMLDECKNVTGSNAKLVWIDDDFLLANNVQQWTEIPLWRVFEGTWNVSTDRAAVAGLRCRPMSETVRDTWAWMAAGAGGVTHARQGEHGLDARRERTLLDGWAGRR